MLKNQDKIKDLFSEKLGNYQAPVNPELWSSIASQIGTTTTVATGTSIIVKSIIGVAAASIVAVGTYLALNSSDDVSVKENNKGVEISKIDDKTSSNEALNPSSKESNDNNNADNSVINKENPQNLEKEKQDEFSKTNSVIEEQAHQEERLVFQEKPVQKETGKSQENDKKQATNPKDEKKKDEKTSVESSSKATNNSTSVGSSAIGKPSPQKALAEITDLPNVFTVSNNYGNLGLVIGYTGDFKDFNLVIMSRDNQVVFKSNNPDFKWNGEMLNGEMSPAGTYYYIITARDANGIAINKSQTLTIL